RRSNVPSGTSPRSDVRVSIRSRRGASGWTPGASRRRPADVRNLPLAERDLQYRLGGLGEEVVALVVDDDERGEVLDLDLPHRFHAELGVLQHLDARDAVLREPGRGTTDRAEVEAAVLLARLGNLLGAVA